MPGSANGTRADYAPREEQNLIKPFPLYWSSRMTNRFKSMEEPLRGRRMRSGYCAIGRRSGHLAAVSEKRVPCPGD